MFNEIPRLVEMTNALGRQGLQARMPESTERTFETVAGVPFSLLTDLVDHLRRVQVVLYTTDLDGRVVELPTLLRPSARVSTAKGQSYT